MGLKSKPQDLSSFSALTLLVGSFDLYKPVLDMTYNVFRGTLNLAQSKTQLYRPGSGSATLDLYSNGQWQHSCHKDLYSQICE